MNGVGVILRFGKRVVIDYKEKVTAKNDGLREGAYIPITMRELYLLKLQEQHI